MEITIKPPNGCNPNEIKHEARHIQNGFVEISTYPNGVKIVYTYMNGKMNAVSSKPLIKIDDYTWQVPD